MNEVNIFEIAAKRKYRFPYKGMVTVEDLFDLSKTELNKVYQTLSASVKIKADSLMSDRTKEDVVLANKMDIVKYIFEQKVAAENAAEAAQAIKEKKQKILAVMSKKQDESLESASMEDLQKMLEEL